MTKRGSASEYVSFLLFAASFVTSYNASASPHHRNDNEPVSALRRPRAFSIERVYAMDIQFSPSRQALIDDTPMSMNDAQAKESADEAEKDQGTVPSAEKDEIPMILAKWVVPLGQPVSNATAFTKAIPLSKEETKDQNLQKALNSGGYISLDGPQEVSQPRINGTSAGRYLIIDVTKRESVRVVVVTFSFSIPNLRCAPPAIKLPGADVKAIANAIRGSLVDSLFCDIEGELNFVFGEVHFENAEAAAVGESFLSGICVGIGFEIRGNGSQASPLAEASITAVISSSSSL